MKRLDTISAVVHGRDRIVYFCITVTVGWNLINCYAITSTSGWPALSQLTQIPGRSQFMHKLHINLNFPARLPCYDRQNIDECYRHDQDSLISIFII